MLLVKSVMVEGDGERVEELHKTLSHDIAALKRSLLPSPLPTKSVLARSRKNRNTRTYTQKPRESITVDNDRNTNRSHVRISFK